jgi:F0F1-type ATP synthase assembly protein I
MTDRPDDREQAGRRGGAQRQGRAYQGAFEAVIAILIGSGIGLWVDNRYETSPYGLLIGTVIGFSSFVLRLVRLGRNLHEQADEEAAAGGDSGSGAPDQ